MSEVNKMSDHPELLKQLALEVIDGIPLDGVKIYTDGSEGDANTTGSGVLIEKLGHDIKIQRKMLITLLSRTKLIVFCMVFH
ncbi:hypothetical protein TNCV_1561701 [Trichonephila clavipes]|nr:hypothetical protein TNCV_1561701 [Trichonephila clavipes]